MCPHTLIGIKLFVQTFSVSEMVDSQQWHGVQPISAGAALLAEDTKIKELSLLKEPDS